MPELSTLGARIKSTLFAEIDTNNFDDIAKAKLDGLQPQEALPNELIEGSAVWLNGLTFQVSDWKARIDGVIYTGSAETVTLDAADATNPRIDVIVVNTGGTADKVTGTPAADPAEPEVNPLTQVKVTFVLIAATATTPSNIVNENVYLENTEWTSAEIDSGTNIDLAAVANPNTGTTHIRFSSAVNGDAITLTDSTVHSSTEFNNLIFAIQNTVANTNTQRRPRIALYNGTTRVSSWVDIRHGTYSFDGANIADYQNITIPIADFALGSNQFDRIKFEVVSNGANTLSFDLDDVVLQSGLVVIVQGVTQADVDLAVLNKPQQISIACTAIDGDIEAGITYARWVPRYDIEITAVYGSLETAPDGSAAIIDIHAGGTTIMTTDKIEIDDGDTDSTDAATQPALTTTTIAAGTEVLMIVDQAGSSTAGAGLVVDIMYHQR